MTSDTAAQFFMRPLGVDDLATLSLWLERLSDLTLFDSQSTLPVNKQILEKDWEKAISGSLPRNCFWFGVENGQGELSGVAGIEAISYINGDCVLPIILAENVRHQGLGQQIAAMLVDMAFNELRLNRITTYFRADNLATRKLVTALGFVEEGCMRNAQFSDGQYFDQIVVGLLAEDWPEKRDELASWTTSKIKLKFGRCDCAGTQ